MAANIQELTNAVTSDSDLMARLEKAQNAQEVSDLLAEKGITVSADVIDEFMDQQQGAGELSEEDLEKVAGGGFKLRYINPFYWVGRLIAYAVTKDM